jgi:phage-Barnase-EndoU-ColicinE5/D-RelE like nuclease3
MIAAVEAARRMWEHNGHQAYAFGDVTSGEAARLRQEIGANLNGFTRFMATSGVRHVKNNHSDPVREAAQKQYAVKPTDFGLIPEIVAVGKTRLIGKIGGRKPARIEYRAILNGRVYIYLETMGLSEKRLELWTMRIDQVDKGGG